MWLDSPWLRHYQKSSSSIASLASGTMKQSAMKHYVLPGGDSLVQVIFVGEPTFSIISEPAVLTTTHQA
jgi:hypothetical protein